MENLWYINLCLEYDTFYYTYLDVILPVPKFFFIINQ
jgi:hypothetical protein